MSMVCNPSGYTDGGRLDVMQVGRTPPRKKRRVAVHRVNVATMEALKAQLEAERDKYIADNPCLNILGCQLVCPDSSIMTICSSAKFISVISDMDCFYLRQELKERFFNVVLAVVNTI